MTTAHEPDCSAAEAAFRPTWRRALVATVLAIVGVLLPQEVPLEWYPLNEPGNDILYLELTVASNKDGEVQVFYNATQGINQLHSIRFPISPTEQTFTYTFPLLDAPITELRLDPPANGATLHIRRMRIIDRRSDENRRFTRDDFVPVQQIESISPLNDGWAITSTPGSNDPYLRITLPTPIVAKGLNYRNFLRSVLSTGYLAMMLWIILLAVLFACYRPARWRDLIPPVLFMALLAALFAPVGNRGLIRNSIHYSRFQPPPLPKDLRLEIDLVSSGPSPTQIFWDIGRGINGDDSYRRALETHDGLQTVRFILPAEEIKELRYDPRDNEGSVTIRGIRVVDSAQVTRAVVPTDTFDVVREIAEYRTDELDRLHVQTTPAATDPILSFKPAAMEMINRAIRDARER